MSYDASAALEMRGVSGAYDVSGGVAVVADNTWRAFQAAEAVEAQSGARLPMPAEHGMSTGPRLTRALCRAIRTAACETMAM